jgi:hypothetical protein
VTQDQIDQNLLLTKAIEETIQVLQSDQASQNPKNWSPAPEIGAALAADGLNRKILAEKYLGADAWETSGAHQSRGSMDGAWRPFSGCLPQLKENATAAIPPMKHKVLDDRSRARVTAMFILTDTDEDANGAEQANPHSPPETDH